MHLQRQRTASHDPKTGSGTRCVAMITASACRVLGWTHGKTSRPQGAPAHDFGSAPNPRNLSRIAPRKDSQGARTAGRFRGAGGLRSEEHTSELQSLRHLVCRLLLEKKKKIKSRNQEKCRRRNRYCAYSIVSSP